MASYAYLPPSLAGMSGINFYDKKSALPNQSGIWRRGDFLFQQTTGTITNPNPNGSLATITPTAPVTLGLTTSAGAPAQTLVGFYTYIGAGSIESLPSAEFPIYVPAGNEATVTVPTAGAPGAAVDFALYVGLLPGTEVQQVASTALGSAATVPSPLTNYAGVTRAATNQSTGIVGMALEDYDCYNAPRPINAAQIGSRSLFGVDMTAPPLGFYEYYSAFFVTTRAGSQLFEMSLVQPYYPSLVNSQTTAGLLYSSTYDTFAVDTSQSNKILTIVGKANGSLNPTYGDPVGTIGDSGARVLVRFNSGYVF